MKQFNENWDGVSRKNIIKEATRGGALNPATSTAATKAAVKAAEAEKAAVKAAEAAAAPALARAEAIHRKGFKLMLKAEEATNMMTRTAHYGPFLGNYGERLAAAKVAAAKADAAFDAAQQDYAKADAAYEAVYDAAYDAAYRAYIATAPNKK